MRQKILSTQRELFGAVSWWCAALTIGLLYHYTSGTESSRMYTSRGLEGRMPSKKSDHLVAVLLAMRKAATKKRYLGDGAAVPTPATLGWS